MYACMYMHTYTLYLYIIDIYIYRDRIDAYCTVAASGLTQTSLGSIPTPYTLWPSVRPETTSLTGGPAIITTGYFGAF